MSTIQIETSLLSFPEKLWYLINDPKCGEITWNDEGTTLVIPNNQAFSFKILNNQSRILFKTNNFASFVRQLNLYGFRKVTEYRRKASTSQIIAGMRSEFKHSWFKRDRKDLLQYIKRQNTSKKGHSTAKKQKVNTEPPPSYTRPSPMPSPYPTNNWSMWDSYLQSMSLFPYLPPQYNLPPHGASSYGEPYSPFAIQGPVRDSRSLGLAGMPPCGGPVSHMFPYNAPTTLEDARLGYAPSTQGQDDAIRSQTDRSSSTSKPAVVIINNTLSAIPDNRAGGCHDNNNATPNKKPFPVQTATCTGAAPHDTDQEESRDAGWRDMYSDKASKLSEPNVSCKEEPVVSPFKEEAENMASHCEPVSIDSEEIAVCKELPNGVLHDSSFSDVTTGSTFPDESGVDKEERAEHEELPSNQDHDAIAVNGCQEDEALPSSQSIVVNGCTGYQVLRGDERPTEVEHKEKRGELSSYKRVKLEINVI